MKKYAKKIAVLVVASCALVVFFQNCGQAGFENDEADLSSSHIDSKYSGLPFPYEISVNQLAYMSCPMTSTGANDQMFSFRVGAYENSEYPVNGMGISQAGIKINSAYFTQLTSSFSSYSEDVKKNKLVEALATGANAVNATPFFSLRSRSETRTNPVMYSVGNTQRLMLGVLSDPVYTQTFRDLYSVLPVKTVGFFNYAKFTTGSPLKSLNGAISLPDSQNMRGDIGNSLLTIGFANPNRMLGTFDSPVPFAPDSDGDGSTDDENAFMYGAGLSVAFNSPRSFYTNALRSLQVTQEVDLATSYSVSATWDCSRRFKIVPEEVRESNMWVSATTIAKKCPVETFNARHASAANVQAYHLLRRFLNPEAWDINVSAGCVVPKIANTCYSNASNVAYDEFYFANPQVATPSTPQQYAGCEGNGAGFAQCPHYVTLCVRR